jgi:hypothetical protein
MLRRRTVEPGRRDIFVPFSSVSATILLEATFCFHRGSQSGAFKERALMSSKASSLAVAAIVLFMGISRGPATAQVREFYLSTSIAHGAAATVFCAGGFHLASIWEILNPGALRYNSTWGATRGDSGSGPPAGLAGWVRTGYDASNAAGSPAGTVNCLAYTTTGGYGTTAQLPVTTWISSDSRVGPWEVIAAPCNVHQRVWCVED